MEVAPSLTVCVFRFGKERAPGCRPCLRSDYLLNCPYLSHGIRFWCLYSSDYQLISCRPALLILLASLALFPMRTGNALKFPLRHHLLLRRLCQSVNKVQLRRGSSKTISWPALPFLVRYPWFIWANHELISHIDIDIEEEAELELGILEERARKRRFGALIAHLPYSKVDWAIPTQMLDAGGTCIIPGAGCKGVSMNTNPLFTRLRVHLKTAVHLVNFPLCLRPWHIPSAKTTHWRMIYLLETWRKGCKCCCRCHISSPRA